MTTVYLLTAGNHGRALAHVAKLLHLPSLILVPRTVEQWSIDAIASEGATVQVVDADYDSAVQQAAAIAESNGDLLIQDTAWDGYEEIPLVGVRFGEYNANHAEGHRPRVYPTVRRS